jgi:hypothetical protein
MSKEVTVIAEELALQAGGAVWLNDKVSTKDIQQFAIEYDAYSNNGGALTGKLQIHASFDGQNFKLAQEVTFTEDADDILAVNNWAYPFMRLRWQDTGSSEPILYLFLSLTK